MAYPFFSAKVIAASVVYWHSPVLPLKFSICRLLIDRVRAEKDICCKHCINGQPRGNTCISVKVNKARQLPRTALAFPAGFEPALPP
jgi:hypothetical protein